MVNFNHKVDSWKIYFTVHNKTIVKLFKSVENKDRKIIRDLFSRFRREAIFQQHIAIVPSLKKLNVKSMVL